MEPLPAQKFLGFEADLDAEAHENTVVFQIHGDSYWASVTLIQWQLVVNLRDWLIKYCKEAGVGQ